MPAQVLCSAAMSACEGESQWQVAFEIFRQQELLGGKIDPATLSTQHAPTVMGQMTNAIPWNSWNSFMESQ